MFDVFETQKKLIEAALPSGFEGSVGKLLAEMAKPFADEIKSDALGNVICRKKGGGKRIMLSAHMDTIGFIATFIDKKGYIRFELIGGHNPFMLHRVPVRFENGTRGIIMCEKWGKETQNPLQNISSNALYIDIGATDFETASKLVRVGDVAVFDTYASTQNGCVITPYADDLVACIVLLLTMEQLKNSPYDLYFVFSAQEEVGLRGAATAAYGIDPHMGIAVDVCSTGDTHANPIYMAVEMGKGPTVKIRDGSLLCNPQVIDFLRKGAEKAGVAYQDEILLAGGTDAGAIQRTRGGVLSGGVSIPTRNVHSPVETYSIGDVQGAATLLVSALESGADF